MKRFTGLLNRTKSQDAAAMQADVDSPEANVGRGVRLFCESGAPSNQGEEVLHLPVIVDGAESSPQAALVAAHQIRKFLSKDHYHKPHVQYNAIMLIRILTDNPGATFTKGFDQKFVLTVRDLLRNGRDASVQQITRETLDALEVEKAQADQNLAPLMMMWRKEKGQGASLQHRHGNGSQAAQSFHVPPFDTNAAAPPSQQQPGQRIFTRKQLPPPFELASRIEEARNTAKILLQLIQSTPPEEVTQNELIREFAERTQGAQKSMQGYINCDSPAPDHDTLQTIIETNEQLNLAQSRHQRAILSARRAMGHNTGPNSEALQDGTGAFSNPPAPGQRESMFSQSATANEPSPPSPPARNVNRESTNGFASSFRAFSSEPFTPEPATSNNNNMSAFAVPAGPPPNMRRSLQTRQSRSPPPRLRPQAEHGPISDPFADTPEHERNPPPLAFEPQHYGPPVRRNTTDLENAYSNPTSPRSDGSRDSLYTSDIAPAPPPKPARPQSDAPSSAYPVSPASESQYTSRDSSGGFVSPTSAMTPHPPSPQRPGVGPWHTSALTQTSVGRQASAANGPTMHGTQGEAGVHEIDGHSELGRTGSSPDSSPVERRVDIAGTGGPRGLTRPRY